VINFGLPRDGRVDLDLYDVSGRFVAEIADGDYPAGYHTVMWEADTRVANGVYVLRLKLGEETISSKTVVWR
jgi:flagellar hook assembly protein FlgD